MNLLKENIKVKKLLPHRAPMLMIDDFSFLTDKIVEASFKIKSSNIFVDKTLFIEIGLVENIAQTCSIIVGSSYIKKDQENNSDVLGYISSIKKMEIYDLPNTNETLISKATLVSRYDGDGYSISIMKGTIHCNEKLLLDCELNLFIKKN